MTPKEICDVAERVANRKAVEGGKRCISVSAKDWEALRDYLEKLEPITQHPMPKRDPATHIVVHGVPVVIG